MRVATRRESEGVSSRPVRLVFKSPVKSGYWVPNMVTETLTG